MALKPELEKQYKATARVFGLNTDDYKTEEAFEDALRKAISKKKTEKFALSEDKAVYVAHAVELAKDVLPSVTDARGMEREELRKHILDRVRKTEELYRYCLEHKLDVDKIKVMAARTE